MKSGRKNLIFLLLFVFFLPVYAENAPESEEDLVRMTRLLFLSPYNSAGKYEQALAECERKLAELPRDTQSLYPAYCYQNMVYALRGLNRNEELDKLVDRFLHDWKTNLPFLAVVSMYDLPSIGFWQDHRFHRTETGFRRYYGVFSFRRHDRARLLRVMLSPEVRETAGKADPLTRVLFCRNLVKHLAALPPDDSPDIPTQYGEDIPGLEPLPLPPQKAGNGPTDRERIQSILALMKKDSEANPDDTRIRQALLDAQSFAEVLFGKKHVPIFGISASPFDKTSWKSLFQKNTPALSTEYEKWQRDLPESMIREIERIMADPGFDSPAAAEKAVIAILTGQAKPAFGLSTFFMDTMPGFTPEDERGKDPDLTAFLLEARLALRDNGCSLLPADSAVSLLERHIRSKFFQVKEGKAVWTDSDALAASVCARMEKDRTLAPALRLWPDRADLSPFALAMLARAFPPDMPEYAELKNQLLSSLKDGLASRDYGAALLFLSEREPDHPLLPVLLNTTAQFRTPDLFAIRGAFRAIRYGILATPDAPFFRPGPDREPGLRIACVGSRLFLETESESAFLKIRLEADAFEETPFLQTEDGFLVHGSPIFTENGRAVRILCICRLPAGKTVIRIPSSGMLRAELLSSGIFRNR